MARDIAGPQRPDPKGEDPEGLFSGPLSAADAETFPDSWFKELETWKVDEDVTGALGTLKCEFWIFWWKEQPGSDLCWGCTAIEAHAKQAMDKKCGFQGYIFKTYNRFKLYEMVRDYCDKDPFKFGRWCLGEWYKDLKVGAWPRDYVCDLSPDELGRIYGTSENLLQVLELEVPGRKSFQNVSPFAFGPPGPLFLEPGGSGT